MKRRHFTIEGNEMDGVEIDYEPIKEPWAEYVLPDGGRFKMRLAVQRVYQLLDDEGKYAVDQNGDRRLLIQSSNELVVQE